MYLVTRLFMDFGGRFLPSLREFLTGFCSSTVPQAGIPGEDLWELDEPLWVLGERGIPEDLCGAGTQRSPFCFAVVSGKTLPLGQAVPSTKELSGLLSTPK